MKTRLYSPKDYDTIEQWWNGHRSTSVPEKLLPKCGVVVESEEGQLLAAAWLYQDNSIGVAWMAWLVTNPDLAAKRVPSVLTMLLGGVESVCLRLDYTLLFTMTEREALGRWFTKQGFRPNHTGMTQYFKPLK